MKKRSIVLGAATLIAAGGIALSNGNVIQAETQEEPATAQEESGRFNFRMPMRNLSEEDYQQMRKHHSEHHRGRMNGENGFGPHCH